MKKENMEKYYVLNCRHCEAKNRLEMEKAVNETQNALCGSCKKELFLSGEEIFKDIDPRAYEHPWDRASLNKLKQVPGVQTFLKFVLKMIHEKRDKIFNIQNHVLVTDKHLPEYHEMFSRACKRMDLSYVPDFYIYQSPYVNAYTGGVDEAYVSMSSAAFDLLNEKELTYIMGHELAHIHMEHVLLKYAAYILINVGMSLANMTIGFPSALLMPIYMAFLHWNRCSELSADRGGLIATGDYSASIGTNMKLAGGSHVISSKMDPEQFLIQADTAYEKTHEDLLSMIYYMSMTSATTHPFPVWRAGALRSWVNSGDYFDILSGKYEKKVNDKNTDKTEDLFKKAEDEGDFFDQMRNLFTFTN